MSAKRQPNPTWLVRDARHPLLAMRHKCVLFAMASRMSNPDVEVFPTIPTLAADCAMSPASVKASLADLVRWEILERMTRPCAKGRRNFYRVNWAALSATSDHGPPDETGDYPDPSDDGAGGGPDSGSSHGVGGPGSGSSTREVGQDLAHGVGQDLADPPGGGGPGSGPKEETAKEEIREAPTGKNPPNNNSRTEVVVRGTFGGGLTPEERQEAEDLARELPNVTVSATVLSMVKAGRCPSRPQLDVLRAAYASLAGDDRVTADAVAVAVDVWAGRRADQPGLSGYTETDADTAAMRRLLVDAYKVSDARGILPGRVLCHWLDSYLRDAALEPSGWPLTSLRFRVGGYGLPDVEAPKTPRAPVPPQPPARTQEEIDAEAQEHRRNAVAGTAAVLAAMKAAGGHPIARPRPAA